MLICDTHCDTLWVHLPHEWHKTECDVTREMLTAHPDDTRLQVMALYVHTGGMDMRPSCVEQELAVFDSLVKEGCHQVMHVEEAEAGKANLMLSIEGGEAFEGKLEKVGEYARRGVRLAALVWNNENGIGHSAMGKDPTGLTPFGKQLVREMRRYRMAVDISHLNIAGSEEVMDSDFPPLASHSCAYSLCPHARNLTDDQLRKLFRAGGYVGVNFYGLFLKEDGLATLDTVVDHIIYMCNLGGENGVGLGSDFDGISVYPEGLKNAQDIYSLLETMQKRGISNELCQKIAGLNFKQYMHRIDHTPLQD